MHQKNDNQKNETNENTIYTTKMSKWNELGNQITLLNSYYNTMSNFGFKNSMVNLGKFSLEKSEIDAKRGTADLFR